jgi:flagellar motor switch protein FliN
MPQETELTSRVVMNEWIGSLAHVVESMTDQRPEVTGRPLTGAAPGTDASSDEDLLWWEQGFPFSPKAVAWVGAPRATWEFVGTLTLKAAGIETPAVADIKKTWMEIVGQWVSELAGSLRSALGTEASGIAGSEKAPPPQQHEWASVQLCFPETALEPLVAGFSRALVEILDTSAAPPIPAAASRPAEAFPTESQKSPAASPTLDLLLDVELPVSLSFGKTQLALKDVLKLASGSIVELNRGVNEPVEVLVNHCLVARGEVVVVDGNYAVRIQQIASRQERLRSLR